MQILFLMADGFEETEFVTPFDYLQRAGFEVALASVSGKAEVVGSHGLKIQTDFALSEPIPQSSAPSFCRVVGRASGT
jgi:4-methyl-5(b-hydroxyethyl)-thiazole monophosphate biosynthesis